MTPWSTTLAANLAIAAALLRSFQLGELFSRDWCNLDAWTPGCTREAPDLEAERERIVRDERKHRREIDAKLAEAVERARLS